MSDHPSREELEQEDTMALLGRIIAGLQVPVSLRMNLGAADLPLRVLLDRLRGFGWKYHHEVAEQIFDRLMEEWDADDQRVDPEVVNVTFGWNTEDVPDYATSVK